MRSTAYLSHTFFWSRNLIALHYEGLSLDGWSTVEVLQGVCSGAITNILAHLSFGKCIELSAVLKVALTTAWKK
ncbi:hypothetical protein AALO_G00287180 [Alosa alosa]|uniref:Uncharacterized protein n=1 Tax=Alosa alosa TaxID=278164 RepID=A0AAV6FGS5_9TELE|nr:hypothetical protein AALO_G00287180 [Alosa alosa]